MYDRLQQSDITFVLQNSPKISNRPPPLSVRNVENSCTLNLIDDVQQPKTHVIQR